MIWTKNDQKVKKKINLVKFSLIFVVERKLSDDNQLFLERFFCWEFMKNDQNFLLNVMKVKR